MRAILMAAGIGSRISQVVNQPKSTLPVGDTTIIAHTVDMLTKAGAEVAIVVGYQKEVIMDALKDYNVTFYDNPFYRVTNSLGSLWLARDFIRDDETLILASADVYWGKDCLDILLASDEPANMLADKSRCLTGDYFFQLREGGYIVKYGKELVEEERSCENTGIARILPSFIGTFKEHMETLVHEEKYNLWWENVLYNYCEDYPVHVSDTNGCFWGEVDWIQDYERVKAYVEQEQAAK